MSAVRFPAGYHIEALRRDHPRSEFCSGQEQVDDWLATKALQNQEKHLSATKILVDEAGTIAGFYTLATAQVDFADLAAELLRRLPRRNLPVAVLAWLGVRDTDQGRGLGHRLIAQATAEVGAIYARAGAAVEATYSEILANQSQLFAVRAPRAVEPKPPASLMRTMTIDMKTSWIGA